MPSPRTYHFDGAYTEQGWLEPAYLTVDASGQLTALSNQPPDETITVERVQGYALPGFVNAHSHAFQYAMAGTAEHLPPGASGDDFWSWREAMYGLALQLSPDTMEAVAAMVYAEMLRVGYTHVAEFHYLHHHTDGTPYRNLAEMGERLLAAAATAGIRITLVPIFYQRGGFAQPATPRQRRFLSPTLDDYLRLWEASRDITQPHAHASVGVGVHSLRAVDLHDIQAAFAQTPAELPRHIHVAEQPKEIADCLRVLGTRPVQWLLDHLPLDDTYHLVHATHITDAERQGVATSGAHVVLCPTTEGNLGDGRFDLVSYRKARGRWSIGTDSHIGLFPHEELRLLDYEQRITHNQRNILCQREAQDSGTLAYREARQGGLAAVGTSHIAVGFAPGDPLDAVVYDSQHPLLSTTQASHRLSTLLYACDTSALLGTLVQGQWKVQHQRHLAHDTILQRFQQAMQTLRCR